MKEDTSYKIQDKTLPKHNYITLELVRRKFLKDYSDFDLYLFDAIFEDVLQQYEFKTVIVATNYIISCVKKNNYKDMEGNDIKSLYSYFKVSLLFSLKKITGQIRFSWEEDDDY